MGFHGPSQTFNLATAVLSWVRQGVGFSPSAWERLGAFLPAPHDHLLYSLLKDKEQPWCFLEEWRPFSCCLFTDQTQRCPAWGWGGERSREWDFQICLYSQYFLAELLYAAAQGCLEPAGRSPALTRALCSKPQHPTLPFAAGGRHRWVRQSRAGLPGAWCSLWVWSDLSYSCWGWSVVSPSPSPPFCNSKVPLSTGRCLCLYLGIPLRKSSFLHGLLNTQGESLPGCSYWSGV